MGTSTQSKLDWLTSKTLIKEVFEDVIICNNNNEFNARFVFI